MNTKALIAIVILAVVIGLGAYMFSGRDTGEEYAAPTPDTTSNTLRVEENAIVITEQPVGGETALASLVYLATPGFVVIHEEDGGTAGTIIGASAVLEVGENLNVQIPLMRSLRDGEQLYAMLHVDADADGSFDAAVDAPIQSALGGPIMGIFEVTADAATNTPVTI
jgi:hypothetical protein